MDFNDANCDTVPKGCEDSSLLSLAFCKIKSWFVTEYVPYTCGAEGIAFVLQNQGNKVVGASGYKLGYGDLKNVFAIEFDAYYNEVAQDPDRKSQRHVSMIVRSQDAIASETDSYAYNYLPTNFKVFKTYFRLISNKF
jgi:hypothetical protein